MLFNAEVFNLSKQQKMAITLTLVDRPNSNMHPITILRLGAHLHA